MKLEHYPRVLGQECPIQLIAKGKRMRGIRDWEGSTIWHAVQAKKSYSKYAKVVRMYYFCTIALRTPYAPVSIK